MKKFLLFVVLMISPTYSYAAYCLAPCNTNTTTQNFCNYESGWCGSSSSQTIESVGVKPSSLSTRYCTPLFGNMQTPTSGTYIVCYATQEECYNPTTWTASTTGKEYIQGQRCTSNGANTASYGPANIWRCAANYYATNTTTGYKQGSAASTISCSACPGGGKSNPASYSITQCCKDAVTSTDTTGTYNRPSCCYTN